MKHQWRLRNDYQFPAATAQLPDGDGTRYYGWVVNVVGYPGKLYGVVRYTVDSDRVAWIESPTDFGKDQAAAEAWVKQTIADLKAKQAQQ